MTPIEFWQALGKKWRMARSFLKRGLWEEGRDSEIKPWLRVFLRFLILVVREFRHDDCTTRASALTYITLLALVPILAVMFAASRGLGLTGIDSLIENVLIKIRLSPAVGGSASDTAASVGGYIREAVERINFGALGVVGLLGLISTSVMAIGSAEGAFNRIWGVGRGRSVWRRFSDYLSVLTVGPLLIFLALKQSTQFANQMVKDAFGSVHIPPQIPHLLFPMALASLAFSFVYVFLPNTRVRIHCALAGGFVAGFFWQVSQWGYVKFQVGVAKYSALYGTLSALPIFLVWIYLSWVILLLCAEVTFCLQNYRRLSREFLQVNLSVRDRESIALWMVARVAESFVTNTPRWTIGRFSDTLHLRDSVTRIVLAPLLAEGILAELAGGNGILIPGRNPATMRLSEVIEAIQKSGDRISEGSTDGLFHRVVNRTDRLRRLGVEQADLSLTDFLQLENGNTEVPESSA